MVCKLEKWFLQESIIGTLSAYINKQFLKRWRVFFDCATVPVITVCCCPISLFAFLKPINLVTTVPQASCDRAFSLESQLSCPWLQVPHYLARTTVKTNTGFMLLFSLSVMLSIIYFVIRCIFLIEVTDEYEANTSSYSLAWSIIVMFAELGGFILTHIGQQMFWKQHTTFTPMSTFMKHKMESVRTNGSE